ncbi:MAG: hypothetical protein ACT4P6_09215, partial [Gemmatimonadaceae bacterium]
MAASQPLRHHSRDESPIRIDLLADPSLTDDDAAQVFDYLLGRDANRRLLDGTRSVVLPSRGSGVHGGIKIKGAGSQGSVVRLGKLHSKPYALPRYDAEGAATIDAAKDHGRAFAGGMSYQQARQEFTVSRYLSQRGVNVFASLGYGVLRRGTFASWFCLLDIPFRELRDWWQLTGDRAAIERIAATFGESQLELARHDVYLILSGMVALEDGFVRKDFHTAHLAGPNDSYLTKLSYYLFDTNFILAHFANDVYVKDIADHRRLAKATYLRALTGQEHAPSDVDRFKSLLVELKYAEWGMQQRIARLADD